MSILLDLQINIEHHNLPSNDDMKLWCEAALLEERHKEILVVIRCVDETESGQLNEQYRKKKGPTNVLSFKYELPEHTHGNTHYLGDLVICPPVVEQEAKEQDKPILSHFAHMIVHGMLHLQGYDHNNEPDANAMEAIEINILEKLGHNNPYLEKTL